MATITTFAANKINDHFHGKTSWTMPTIYVGVSTTLPTIAGANVTEPTAGTGGYARVTTSGATWNASASGVVTNAAIVAFPQSTAAWSTGATNVAYTTYWDASTAGNLLWFDAITTPQAVNAAGITPQYAIGQLSDTLA